MFKVGTETWKVSPEKEIIYDNETKEKILLSPMTKCTSANRKFQKAKWHTKTQSKSSITRLQTDIGPNLSNDSQPTADIQHDPNLPIHRNGNVSNGHGTTWILKTLQKLQTTMNEDLNWNT